MIGADTTFIVELEIQEHPAHAGARALSVPIPPTSACSDLKCWRHEQTDRAMGGDFLVQMSLQERR